MFDLLILLTKRKQNVLEEGILSAPKFIEFEYNYNWNMNFVFFESLMLGEGEKYHSETKFNA